MATNATCSVTVSPVAESATSSWPEKPSVWSPMPSNSRASTAPSTEPSPKVDSSSSLAQAMKSSSGMTSRMLVAGVLVLEDPGAELHRLAVVGAQVADREVVGVVDRERQLLEVELAALVMRSSSSSSSCGAASQPSGKSSMVMSTASARACASSSTSGSVVVVVDAVVSERGRRLLGLRGGGRVAARRRRRSCRTQRARG